MQVSFTIKDIHSFIPRSLISLVIWYLLEKLRSAFIKVVCRLQDNGKKCIISYRIEGYPLSNLYKCHTLAFYCECLNVDSRRFLVPTHNLQKMRIFILQWTSTPCKYSCVLFFCISECYSRYFRPVRA